MRRALVERWFLGLLKIGEKREFGMSFSVEGLVSSFRNYGSSLSRFSGFGMNFNFMVFFTGSDF